uniref:Putative 26S protease regulatory subunit 4 n=1 Tax=Lygus hesperus TaxID=30085 RepID=A0A0A9XSY1_LYGHE
MSHYEAELRKVETMRSYPLLVATLEEMIDDSHAIVTLVNSMHYVPLLSFVDKERLELGCSVLLHDRQHSIVGVLEDDVNPHVSVMKVDKAPTDTYADIGGL